MKVKCRFCHKLFLKTNGRWKHEAQKHSDKLYLLNKLKCPNCNEMFRNRRRLNDHLKTFHKTQPYFCKQCDKSFSWSSNYKTHMIRHRGVKQYSCQYCKKTFLLYTQQKQHERIHTGEKPFKCRTCGKSFAWRNLKDQCEKRHDNIKFSCPICKKMIAYSYRHGHMRKKHTENPRYKCEQCTRVFILLRDLENHRSSHTGELSYMCKECNKAFADKKSLDAHSRVHTGEVPYFCEECQRSFATLSGYQSHRKNMHSSREKINCFNCGKLFYKSSLRKHQKRCLGFAFKKFVCRFCDVSFRENAQLDRHYMQAHGAPKISEICPRCDKVFEIGRLNAHLINTRYNEAKKKCKFISKSVYDLPSKTSE